MTQLTEHFTLEEMTVSTTAAQKGIDNTPDAAALAELTDLAKVLERVRTLLHGAPIIITSGYRCPEVNAACGGVANSAHVFGRAVDFVAPAFGTPRDIVLALLPHMAELRLDQLIYEYGDWVHLGLHEDDDQARRMALTIDANGTRAFA
jgi:hypothetical protein